MLSLLPLMRLPCSTGAFARFLGLTVSLSLKFIHCSAALHQGLSLLSLLSLPPLYLPIIFHSDYQIIKRSFIS